LCRAKFAAAAQVAGSAKAVRSLTAAECPTAVDFADSGDAD